MMDEEIRTCSIPGCDEPARVGQRYCAGCHATYMRGYRARKKRELDEMREEVLRQRKIIRELREELREGNAGAT